MNSSKLASFTMALALVLPLSTPSLVNANVVMPMEYDNTMPEQTISEPAVVENYNDQMKVSYLTRLLEHQQKAYEDKITYLENELRKSKDRLIEKAISQDKMEDAFKDKYGQEVNLLKRELAYKTKSLMEYQRQIEKMKPSEDLKNMIKLNTELASELRKSEDQIAIIQLKQIESMPNTHTGGARLPASVQKSK